MRRLGLLLLGIATVAGAVSQDDFIKFVQKQSGVTDFVLSTKRVCVCHGGDLDHALGWGRLVVPAPDEEAYLECTVPRWGADGQQRDERGCLASGGASVELLSRRRPFGSHWLRGESSAS